VIRDEEERSDKRKGPGLFFASLCTREGGGSANPYCCYASYFREKRKRAEKGGGVDELAASWVLHLAAVRDRGGGGGARKKKKKGGERGTSIGRGDKEMWEEKEEKKKKRRGKGSLFLYLSLRPEASSKERNFLGKKGGEGGEGGMKLLKDINLGKRSEAALCDRAEQLAD